MVVLLVLLALVVWVALIVVGFVVKSLFWLGIVGIALFVATAAVGLGRLLKA